jgi:hypothetical protein
MNEMHKRALSSIGYQFVESSFLPEGKDEYYLRNEQNKNVYQYRNLTAYEIEVLVRNNNTSDDWNKIQVSNAFNPELVKNCKFYGLVRIGKLESIALEYHNVCMQVGLYDSTIISCDFGDNVVVSNVNYMSHYILGNEVMVSNVHELHCTDHSKFGNGIIKEGEEEEVRIWLEVCNENGGRKILPFNGMLPGDAYIWSKYRDDDALLEKLKEFTELKFDRQRGYYGKVGDRSVIKNTSIVKDVWIGTDAYIKGANKLKNLTIKSTLEAQTQIGEGCELVNGIIDNGCRLFYGVKAVRFIMASNSQLKYGARLINSYLGNNSTISCCEVLNSLIFPAHEQHHNNSFLCAALVMGQSNIAAGATIGSNHNSRAADGEIIAARGFWPGLCVSLKHNSKFSSFTLIAKGDYSYELNIPIPFSLVSNDVSNNRLMVMPAYWFMYNMYALARNSAKYKDRDMRDEIIQNIEYDFLAPDSVNEIFKALDLLKKFTAVAYDPSLAEDEESSIIKKGKALLESGSFKSSDKEIFATGFECSNRPVQLIKVKEAYDIYKQQVAYYGILELIKFIDKHNIASFDKLSEALPASPERTKWVNIGGQVLPDASLSTLLKGVKNGEIIGWDAVHEFYLKNGLLYSEQKLQHAFASLLEIKGLTRAQFTATYFKELLQEGLTTKEWMVKNIYESRAKDYQNEFRKMAYDSDEEMEKVIGKLDENSFINQQQEELAEMKKLIQAISKSFAL